MAKVKKAYFCTACGYEAPKWLGKCPACGEWNTFAEEVVSRGDEKPAPGFARAQTRPVPVGEIEEVHHRRLDTGSTEVNRVLGGGMVRGSLVLLGGEPGIGKSTMALQLALGSRGLRTLYVSGEESPQQIKMRAGRLPGGDGECLVYAETLLEEIIRQAEAVRPDLMVIDSIQTIYSQVLESSPGSVSQIRECAAMLLKYAKTTGTSILLIGHITKDGTIAGPKVLEHIVDVVLQFEGDGNNVYRILRGIKNRFGATYEIGVFEMRNEGLAEVANPSEILLTHYDEPLSGIAVGAAADGIRPYLIEVQSLVGNAAYGTPQRSSTGFDIKRLNMLLAVLEKRVGMKMYQKDVFLNFAGGFKVADTGLDLAVVSAVISSYFDRPLRGRNRTFGRGTSRTAHLSTDTRSRPARFRPYRCIGLLPRQIRGARRHTHRPRQPYRPTTQGHLHRRDVTLPYTARDSYRYFRKRQPNARLFRSSYPKSLPSDAFIRYATEIHVMPCTRDGYGTCDNPPRTARAATNTKRLQSCHTRHKRRPRQKNRIHPSFRQSPLPTRHDGIGLKSNPEASIRHRLSEEAEPEKCTEYREKHPGNSRFPG